jgi:protein-tyrosine-phosphatase
VAGDAGDGEVAERARALVRAAAGNRGMLRPDRPEDVDLADPIGRDIGDYRATAELVDLAVRTFVDRL